MKDKKSLKTTAIMYLLLLILVLLLGRLVFTTFGIGNKIFPAAEKPTDISSKDTSAVYKAENFSSLFSKAMKMQNRLDYEEAIENYRKAIASDPGNALADNAYFNIVQMLDSSKLKNYRTAVNICRKILADYPQTEMADDAQYYIAKTIHTTYDNPLDAINEYEKLIEMFPDSKYAKEAQNVLDYFNSDEDGDGLTEAESIYREMMDERIEEVPEISPPQ